MQNKMKILINKNLNIYKIIQITKDFEKIIFKDFRPFERCNFSQYDLATQKDYFDRLSYLDIPNFHIDLQTSIGMENTSSEQIVLDRAKCEAFKVKNEFFIILFYLSTNSVMKTRCASLNLTTLRMTLSV